MFVTALFWELPQYISGAFPLSLPNSPDPCAMTTVRDPFATAASNSCSVLPTIESIADLEKAGSAMFATHWSRMLGGGGGVMY